MPRTFFKYLAIALVFFNTDAVARPKAKPPITEETPVRQALARFVANKVALKNVAAKQRELHKEIDDAFVEIRRLRLAAHGAKEQGACDVCHEIAAEFCNRPALYPEFCRDDACHVDLEPRRDVCFRVYRSEPCYKTLTPTARARVNECWMVDNHLEVKELETEIDNLKKQLDDVTQEQLDLMKEELALEEECPKCSKLRVPAEVLREAEELE
jgi:hypothetical protein